MRWPTIKYSKRKTLKRGERLLIHPWSTAQAKVLVTKNCTRENPKIRRLRLGAYYSYDRVWHDIGYLRSEIKEGNFVVIKEPRVVKCHDCKGTGKRLRVHYG